ncbi:hypothetical protein Hamer_G012383 [Homarus americanus]|uniref:C2H2-type domain-containing protein n=1 Tax=Homarus americanus TaxID=6706 RepID=A0A8J5KBQ6_HOMAM|nr:hypothetical protein Hamer_G012383 [Homarus americanus]
MSAKYPPLFVNLALDKCVLPVRAVKKSPKGLPYDLACPCLKNELQKRNCGTCGKYFASVKSINAHINKHSSSCMSRHYVVSAPAERLQPQRLAAKRQREFMCVVKYLEK